MYKLTEQPWTMSTHLCASETLGSLIIIPGGKCTTGIKNKNAETILDKAVKILTLCI